MSQYLTVDEIGYFPAGTVPTEGLIIRASAIIDGYCKRSISVTTYTERIPLTNGRGHLSYYPVAEINEVKGRAAYGLTGDTFLVLPDSSQLIRTTSILIRKSEQSGVGVIFSAPRIQSWKLPIQAVGTRYRKR